ncbi:LacI family DNA-binding transcriptional regulator [Kribbella swartbergensis]
MSSTPQLEPDRPPTMRDVAKAAGVPLSAVSLVLNGRSGVSDHRRAQILRAVEDLDYTHRQRPVVRRAKATVGLVMEALSPAAAKDGFMAEVVSGVEVGLRDSGLQMALQLYRNGDDPLAELQTVLGRPVDGVILANGGDIDADAVHRVVDSGLPVVLLENYLEDSADTYAVVADNFTAGYLSTQHLLELGHQRIGMLVGSTRYVSLRDRRHGYQAALLDAGLIPDPALMPAQHHGDPVKGYRQTQHLLALRNPPTAIYAVSDKSAIGAYQAIAEAGLRIPDDISIVGTDDVHQSQLLSPPLTTFHIPRFELGRTAAGTLHSLLERRELAPTRTTLLGALIQRASTRPA